MIEARILLYRDVSMSKEKWCVKPKGDCVGAGAIYTKAFTAFMSGHVVTKIDKTEGTIFAPVFPLQSLTGLWIIAFVSVPTENSYPLKALTFLRHRITMPRIDLNH